MDAAEIVKTYLNRVKSNKPEVLQECFSRLTNSEIEEIIMQCEVELRERNEKKKPE